VLDLARKTEINIYAISLRPRRMQDRNAVKFSQAAHLLTALTQDTGGQVHFPNSLSELDAVYDRIAEELRTQYSIGYVSNNGRRDGKWRPHRGARAHPRGSAGPPQARVLRGRYGHDLALARPAQAVFASRAFSRSSRSWRRARTAISSRRKWPSPARTSWSRRCWSVSTSVPSR